MKKWEEEGLSPAQALGSFRLEGCKNGLHRRSVNGQEAPDGVRIHLAETALLQGKAGAGLQGMGRGTSSPHGHLWDVKRQG